MYASTVAHGQLSTAFQEHCGLLARMMLDYPPWVVMLHDLLIKQELMCLLVGLPVMQGGALEAPSGGETVRRDPGSDESRKGVDKQGIPSVQQGARDRVIETEYGTAGEQSFQVYCQRCNPALKDFSCGIVTIRHIESRCSAGHQPRLSLTPCRA
jgi:hypothetical protein